MYHIFTDLRRLFEQFDLDGDGYIDENELKSVMETMGQSASETDIRTMFRSADTNNDEKISFDGKNAILNHNKMKKVLKLFLKIFVIHLVSG